MRNTVGNYRANTAPTTALSLFTGVPVDSYYLYLSKARASARARTITRSFFTMHKGDHYYARLRNERSGRSIARGRFDKNNPDLDYAPEYNGNLRASFRARRAGFCVYDTCKTGYISGSENTS